MTYVSKKTLRAAYNNEMEAVYRYTGETNPQLKEMKLLAQGRAEAFAAVLSAMNGNSWVLNSFAKEPPTYA